MSNRAGVATFLAAALIGAASIAGVLIAKRRAAEAIAEFSFGLAAPEGEWVFVSGNNAGGDVRGWLVHRKDGRRLALGRLPGRAFQESLYHAFAFSREGTHAAWFTLHESSFGKPHYRLNATDLSLRSPAVARSEFQSQSVPSFAVSPAGGTIAILEGSRITVIDLAKGKPRFSVNFPPVGRTVSHFLVYADDTHLRLVPRQQFEPRPRQQILELDLATRTIHAVGAIESGYSGLFLRASHDAATILALERQRTEISIRDGRTGRRLSSLPPAGKVRSALFLVGKRVALISFSAEFNQRTGVATKVAGPPGLLTLFDVDGRERARIPLDTSAGGAVLEGQPTPQTIRSP